jgi:acetyl-CoA C-acetyltransferase
MRDEVFIVAAKRTPIGGFLGSLSGFTAPQLGAEVIRDAYQSVRLLPEKISSVYFGNVLSANLGQSPARQTSKLAGVPDQVDCTSVNKVCAAGMKAMIMGAQQIELGLDDIVMTGGMESMSNTPHYATLRAGMKFGDETFVDGLLKDGLTDAYNQIHMGNIAELSVAKFGITREEQDAYALNSYARANEATRKGKFKCEITPIHLKTKGGEILFHEDEDIAKIIPEKVAKLKPSFDNNGTITAANASNLNDGAAAVVLASKTALQQYQIKPLARIISYADAAVNPREYAEAPAHAIAIALRRAGLSLQDMDFIEINEAYAAVVLVNQKILGFDLAKTNVYGGAVAMGHPLGASGARIVCTLLSVLKQEKGKYGLAAICNGGGGATAVIIENIG